MDILAKLIARILGWQVKAEGPLPKKCVIIAAPHTSNMDGFYMIVAGFALKIKPNWLVKKSVLETPFGNFLRRLGAIPVDRSAPHHLVNQLSDEFHSREAMILAVPPEGTRSRVDKWKSGFYRIALAAKVPIVLGYVDYGKKMVGYGPVIQPQEGSFANDVAKIQEFYRHMTARFPEKFGAIQIELSKQQREAGASLPSQSN